MSLELIVCGLVLMSICGFFATLFLRALYFGAYKKALLLKSLAGACFVMFGAANCFLNSFSALSVLVFIGLCFGLLGDGFIALCGVFPEKDDAVFSAGGISFITGHGLYIVALIMAGDINIAAAIISVILIYVPGRIYARRTQFIKSRMKFQLTGYLGIVIAMTAVAIGLFVGRLTLGAGLFALGGLCFVVSDNLLFAYKYGAAPKFWQNIALHVTYYMAQFAIAWSIAFI